MDGRSHEYCCCAIPTMNVGIYLAIAEQFSIGLVAGILAVATPSIVGAATPGIAPWIFAIICFVVCGIQALGFLGVFKEKTTLFARYAQINTFAVSALFGVAATWIIVSATRHSTAQTSCIDNFFNNSTLTNTTSGDVGGNLGAASTADEGQDVCRIWTWAEIGVMGALWLVMLIFQGYLLLLCHWYASTQQADHSKYYSIYSVDAPQGIPLAERQQDAWDPRPSTDSWSGSGMRGGPTSPTSPQGFYRDHSRQNSEATERGYGVNADAYENKPSQYGYSANAGVAGEKRQRSEGMVEASFSPSSAYPDSSESQPQQYGSPPERKRTLQSGRAPQAPPPGARFPDTEDYYQGSGYPSTAPYTQRTYAQSSAPSYHTDYPQQPYHGQR